MDPDANLKEQLELARMIELETAPAYAAERLAGLVMDLHRWIANGGFLPKAWQKESK